MNNNINNKMIVKELKKLVDNLLDSSKLDIGMTELRLNKENLSRIVNNCIDELSYIAKARNIILESKVPEEIYLELDRLRFGQVIFNIISTSNEDEYLLLSDHILLFPNHNLFLRQAYKAILRLLIFPAQIFLSLLQSFR